MAVQVRLDWLAPLDAGLFLCPSDAVIFMPATRFHLPDPPLCPPEPAFRQRQERSITLVSYLLPTRWACYFVNDDPSGLDEDEIAAADAWWQETFPHQSASCFAADEEYGYAVFHDAAGYCKATDCTLYRFLLTAAKAPPAGAPPVGAPARLAQP